MTKDIGFPTIEYYLPEMMEFVSNLAKEYQSGYLRSWQMMTQRVQAFFSPDRLDKVDVVAPGWREMSAYADGMTLVHVMCVFTGLLLCPEFKQASRIQQELMKWIVLFHDIAKEVRNGQGDRIHGFRSAVRAGAILPKIGFVVTAEYDSLFEEWCTLVNTAITKRGEPSVYVQDNRKLPEIIEGMERLFGHDTPATLIVKTVLLHMSINVIKEYPNAAPLTEIEIRQYLDPRLFPLLKMMMLADSDGWTLFDPSTKERYRREILTVFGGISSLQIVSTESQQQVTG